MAAHMITSGVHLRERDHLKTKALIIFAMLKGDTTISLT